MKKPKKTGIYCIENIVNNYKYIGQAVNIDNRNKYHYQLLRRKAHPNPYLQNSWSKYGEQNFIHYILEECHRSELTNKEIQAIQDLNTMVVKDFGYNGFGYNMGWPDMRCTPSLEARKKMSLSKTGKKPSFETRIRMGISHKGFKHSDESIKKISEKQKGKKLSETHLANLRKANTEKIGLKHSDETRKKMSITRKGRKKSPEWIAKIRKSNKGHLVASETREKIRTTLSGRKKTFEENEMYKFARYVLPFVVAY